MEVSILALVLSYAWLSVAETVSNQYVVYFDAIVSLNSTL